MERFQHVVRFSVYGHSHQEDFRVTMAQGTQDAIGAYIVAGAGTTLGGINPGFTVIDWDEEFMVPLEFHTYYMDLVEANKNPDVTPEFKLHHSFK